MRPMPSPRLLAVPLALAVLAVPACASTTSATPEVTPAPISTPTPTRTPEPTADPTPAASATATPGASGTPQGTATPRGTATPGGTATPKGTATPSGSASPAATSGPAKPMPAGQVDCGQVKCVALTFDDGPGKDTGRLLDILNRKGARATFFMQGVNVKADPAMAKRVADTPGMEVANHSISHPDLTKLGAAGVRKEISGNQQRIADTTGKTTKVFRPPYGATNSTVREIAGETGEAVILWDVDTLDWQSRNPTAIRKVVAQQTRNGSVILMHDIHSTTVDAVENVVTDLQNDGYQVVTVTELFGSTSPGKTYTNRS
ncbi:polysaccharide deacetylase family protein [Granulicoccus phenolivorans]|uniref:polysaccharide deacetylase family protein n=1 Tax=Granulicoccus phenolivorans TaxID=266854 RepID=UPI000424EBB3|nr:polysaccharide deacetylase family protein [Granulicoccus phenolivorans]